MYANAATKIAVPKVQLSGSKRQYLQKTPKTSRKADDFRSFMPAGLI
jgi:hypothetical protein